MNRLGPDWWKHAVVYQIYPRSFADSNGDGVGDLGGILAHLDDLVDLGVDALWLSPIHPSPQRDFGYDISDYDGIDPLFGTQADFDALVDQAHRRGLRIVLDLVVNHTSDQHPWFRDHPDWYLRHPGVNGRPPNNWFSLFELKSAWWPDPVNGGYYLGTFTRHQPELDWRNPEVAEAVFAMMRRWLARGVDGFRLDVVNWYIKDEAWRSNPWRLSLNPPDLQNHLYDRNQPGSHEVARRMRALVDEFPDRVLIGEVFTDDPSLAVSYQGRGADELHLAFNFSFLFSPWSARAFQHRLAQWQDLLPPGGWPNQTLSNHDQKRHISRYASGRHTEARARVAAALLLLVRGTPFLYYGEEIGLADRPMAKKDIRDPKGLMLWPLLEGRDPCRTPLPWSNQPGAGFSPPGSAAPWLPLGPEWATRNVAAQKADPSSLWHWYRSLLALRRDHEALYAGDQAWLTDAADNRRGLVGFRRTSPEGGQSVEVWLNFGSKPQTFSPTAGAKVLLGAPIDGRDPVLGGHGVVVLQVRPEGKPSGD